VNIIKSFFMCLAVAGLGVLAGPAVTQSTVSVEYNVDRPGYDYRQFDLSAADPNICRNACANDGQCRAFTYVAAGLQGPYARWWLKSVAPAATSNRCCVSGVKAAGPVVAASTVSAEYNVDRPGYDYRQFDLSAADPNICRNACASDGQCRAFTYVAPGLQGPYARCWLKSAVPPPAASRCCVSGVKMAAGPVPAPAPTPAPTPTPATSLLTGKWSGPSGTYDIVEYADHTFTWTVGSPTPFELGRGTNNGGVLNATWGPYPSGTGGGPERGDFKEPRADGLPMAIYWTNQVQFHRILP
jgi:hypothetical protein